MADVAIYVQTEYAKKAYARESYNVRIWPGMEMIRDALTRGGVETEYAGLATVHNYKIILMSITSPIDWFSFIAERAQWRQGSYTVIVGGAGILNIRPVLNHADIFVFGRAENFVVDLVKTVLKGDRFSGPGVVYRDEFSMDREIVINQAGECYPFRYLQANGKPLKETSIGCRRKCLFCSYTWNRKHVSTTSADGVYNLDGGSSDERTIWEYDLNHPDSWVSEGRYVIVGVDGFSERLRFMVNKPITNDLLFNYIRRIPEISRVYRVKLFNIIGYPTETDRDWQEFIDLFVEADRVAKAREDGRIVRVEIISTPFKAMPGTPAAVWPMLYKDLRHYQAKFKITKNKWPTNIYAGRTMSFNYMSSIESLATITLWALMLRGIESDIELINTLSQYKKFWSADSKTRRLTLEKYLDIDRLFRAYDWSDLPTRNVRGVVDNSTMEKVGGRFFSRFSDSTKHEPRSIHGPRRI